MKKEIFPIIIVLLTNFVWAQNPDFPKYKTIVDKFFEKYSSETGDSYSDFKFEKRPEGWFAVRLSYPEKEYLKKELFWDAKTKTFQEIDFPSKDTYKVVGQPAKTPYNKWEAQVYNACYYYGYLGWEKDVISELEGKKNLSDTTLYGLARAYSSYASGLLNNNSGMADSSAIFKMPDAPNAFTKTQLEEYRHYRHKAIENFAKVAEINPDFQTIVGDIGVKYANEHMTAFLDLRTYQNEKEAHKELKPDIYSKEHIAFAKNILNSCPKNAILFSNGDNDTYMTLYAQEQLGIRKDVTVLNLALLNTEPYIRHLQNLKLAKTSIDADTYKGENLLLVWISPGVQKDTSLSLSEALNFLKDKENTIKSYSTEYSYLPTRDFYVQSKNKKLEFKISSSYILRSEIVILDLINSNFGKRPICYSSTSSTGNLKDLEKFFSLEGFVNEIDVSFSEKNIKVDTKTSYQKLMKEFDYSGLKEMQKDDLSKFYINLFYELTSAFLETDQTDKALEVTEKCFEVINNQHIFETYLVIAFIESYYKAGKNVKAKQIAEKSKDAIANDDGKSIELQGYIIAEIDRIIEKYEK